MLHFSRVQMQPVRSWLRAEQEWEGLCLSSRTVCHSSWMQRMPSKLILPIQIGTDTLPSEPGHSEHWSTFYQQLCKPPWAQIHIQQQQTISGALWSK